MFVLIPHRRSKHFFIVKHTSVSHIMYAGHMFPRIQCVGRAWWGLRGVTWCRPGRGREGVGGANAFQWEKKWNLADNRITASLVQMEAFWTQVLHSATSRHPQRTSSITGSKESSGEKQPRCLSIWTDIGKWFPVITSRSTSRPLVSRAQLVIVDDRPGEGQLQTVKVKVFIVNF